MNKWYRSAPCKAVLVVLAHIFAAVSVVSLFWILSYPAVNLDDVLHSNLKYEDSQAFESRFLSVANDVIWAEPLLREFETDGAFDESKLVDIEEYDQNNKVTGENKSGIAYRLGDLIKWSENGYETEGGYWGEDGYYYPDYSGSNIVVCKREDGTYQYYYADEFRRLASDGELKFSALLSEQLAEEWGIQDVQDLIDLFFSGDADDKLFQNILDKDNKLIYTSCWLYDGMWVEEQYAPDGAENILEIVNNNPKWNGKLDKIMEMLSYTVGNIAPSVYDCQGVDKVWSEGNTNFIYLIVDLDHKAIYTNREAYRSLEAWKDNVERITKMGKFVMVTPKLAEFKTNTNMMATTWQSIGDNLDSDNYVCAFAVDTKYPIQDTFYGDQQDYNRYAPITGSVMAAFTLAVLGFLVCLIWLTVVAGRNNREEGVKLTFVDRIKTEVFLLIAGIFCVTSFLILLEYAENVTDIVVESDVSYAPYGESLALMSRAIVNGMTPYKILLLAAGAVICCAAAMFLWLGLVRRLKAGTLWRNSLLRKFVEFSKIVIANMNLVWKTIVAFGVLVLIHLIGFMSRYLLGIRGGVFFLVMILVDAAVFGYLIYNAIGRDRIKKGVETIAGGQVDFQIPLEGLRGEQLKVAQEINKIGDGLEKAVEKSMKDERMKTDLITNVSHDIKTPLTSIINYVELLKRENFEDPKIQNYLKVLEEKSQRLKTLTEDVVEASKVSSGNIKLEKMNLNLVELINQTCAELEEKFEARNLTLMVNVPEEPVIVNADGRRMWRVLANIFNNAAKYAMEGTRVYADLKRNGDEVGFTLKNVSEQPLNITADELTERFIRGDVSRSTEGSGLGLSIAKNLMELQGGSFELYLDGDLFKVVIRMKCVE